MKKGISLALALALALALGLTACSTASGGAADTPAANSGAPAVETSAQPSAETPENVTITSLNGSGEAVELEVPYDPQRIAILDMAFLDILDALGVAEGRVVGSADTSLEYLQS